MWNRAAGADGTVEGEELSGCDQDLLPCGLQSDDHSGGEADLICLFFFLGWSFLGNLDSLP